MRSQPAISSSYMTRSAAVRSSAVGSLLIWKWRMTSDDQYNIIC
jgi:hypothetical protein